MLAGLFTADHKTGQRRFAIVTTEPNAMAAEVHDRMPAILNDMSMKVWLSPHSDPQPLKWICRPYEDQGFTAAPESRTCTSGLNRQTKTDLIWGYKAKSFSLNEQALSE